MNHECTRALKANKGMDITVECSCGKSNTVSGDGSPHLALVRAINWFANHVRVAEAE